MCYSSTVSTYIYGKDADHLFQGMLALKKLGQIKRTSSKLKAIKSKSIHTYTVVLATCEQQPRSYLYTHKIIVHVF